MVCDVLVSLPAFSSAKQHENPIWVACTSRAVCKATYPEVGEAVLALHILNPESDLPVGI